MTKFLIDCENTMTMCAVNKLKGHTGRAFLGILHTASRAEAAFAAEGNKFHVVASGADIHGTAKRRIATIQHFIDIFHLRISGMKSVFDYFIIVIKDFLQDIFNFSNLPAGASISGFLIDLPPSNNFFKFQILYSFYC